MLKLTPHWLFPIQIVHSLCANSLQSSIDGLQFWNSACTENWIFNAHFLHFVEICRFSFGLKIFRPYSEQKSGHSIYFAHLLSIANWALSIALRIHCSLGGCRKVESHWHCVHFALHFTNWSLSCKEVTRFTFLNMMIAQIDQSHYGDCQHLLIVNWCFYLGVSWGSICIAKCNFFISFGSKFCCKPA